MENTNAIFTRTRLGLDTRVWLTMLLVFFISLLLVSFKMATAVHCTDYVITPSAVTADKPNSFYTGETIVFSASVPSGGNLVWDFNDGTQPASGNHIKHAFKHDGSYTITTTFDETCIQSLKINIKEFVSKISMVSPSNNDLANIINGTDTPHVGEKAMFSSAKSAAMYEWSVLNSPEYPTQTDSAVAWQFKTPGKQIIVLKINGDDKKVYKKQVIVLQSLQAKSAGVVPKPLPPPVAIPPKITSFEPVSGGTNTIVTIKGFNFSNVTAVSFGGIPAASFAPLSPTTISATVGAGASGNISVTTKNGVGVSMTMMFTYIAPVVNNNTPATQPAKPKTVMIAPEEFAHLFQQVCDGKSDASAFGSYLCSGDATKVLADNEWTTLGKFCEKLKGKKKGLLGLSRKEYKINSVKVSRDAANNNCVTNLTVDYK